MPLRVAAQRRDEIGSSSTRTCASKIGFVARLYIRRADRGRHTRDESCVALSGAFPTGVVESLAALRPALDRRDGTAQRLRRLVARPPLEAAENHRYGQRGRKTIRCK